MAGTDANQANIGNGGIDILDLLDLLDLLGNLVDSFSNSALGGINSVAVKNNQAAVAITAPTKTDPGLVRLYNATTLATLA